MNLFEQAKQQNSAQFLARMTGNLRALRVEYQCTEDFEFPVKFHTWVAEEALKIVKFAMEQARKGKEEQHGNDGQPENESEVMQ